MPLKTAFAPHLGRDVKFGRIRPPAGYQHRHRFAKYTADLPVPPVSLAPSSLSLSPLAMASLRNIYGNDALGDCVIAGAYHSVGVFTGNAGKLFVATPQQIVSDYSAIGGYRPGHPNTDNGCDAPTALKYWQTHGFANGTKLAGSLSVDPNNWTEVTQAMYLFESLYFAVSMPDAWVSPMPQGDGFVWGAAGPPDDEYGHCFVAYGYGPNGVNIDTWALFGTVTKEAVAKYAAESAGGELYALLSPDSINKATAKAPNGLDWATLAADFNADGGSVVVVPVPNPIPAPTPPAPIPVPDPVPAPTPTPPPPPVSASEPVVISIGGVSKSYTYYPMNSIRPVGEVVYLMVNNVVKLDGVLVPV